MAAPSLPSAIAAGCEGADRQRGPGDARDRPHLRGLQRAHQVIDPVEPLQQRRRTDEPVGRSFADHAQHVCQLLGHVRMLAQASRHRRVDQAGIDGVRRSSHQVQGLARSDEGEELNVLGKHAGAACVHIVDALGLFGEQCARHADVVASFGQVVRNACEPGADRRNAGLQAAEHGLANGDCFAVELDTSFHLAHQSDHVIRQIGRIGEQCGFVGVAGLAGLALWLW